MTKHVLKTVGLFRVALIAAVGIPFITLSSYAQQQAPAPAPAAAGTQAGAQGTSAEVERVIVTGSNIPTAEEVGPNPVLSLNRDLINKSGERNTEDLLKRLPVANSNSIPVQNNGTSQGGPAGTASVSLRGFDNSATLVLVNGRRVAPYPGSGFVDLNTIPLSAVESIEVLKDGASATYGADAVAGVINIKTYKDFRGAQLTLQYGNTQDKDAGLYSGDLLFGTGDDKMSITGDLFFYHHNSMFNRDRGNSLKPPFLSSNSSPYNLSVNRITVLPAIGLANDPVPGLNPHDNPTFFTNDANGNPILNAMGLMNVGHDPTDFTNRNDATNLAAIPGVRKLLGVDQQADGSFLGFTVNQSFFGTPPTGTNGLASPNNYIYSNGRPRAAFSVLPGFNFNAFSSSFPDQERWGGYASFNDKICDDQLQIYGDFYYVDAKTHDELAAGATNNFITKGQGTLAIAPNHPFPVDVNGNPIVPVGTLAPSDVGIPGNAFNPFNPFEQIISGGTRARLADFGNRLFDNENEAWLSTIGVHGDKLFNGTWGYDSAFRYSEITNISQARDVNVLRYNQINNANDPIFDPNSATFIGTTIPYNPFGDFKNPIASNGPTLDYATLFRRDLNVSKIAQLDTSMYTTDLFDLPAGGVGLAFGGGWSRESNFINPDDQGRLKQEAGVGQSQRSQSGRKKFDLYSEVLVPIFSPAMGIPGFHSLEITGADRYEDFRNNDTNVLVPKVGVRWQPFDDQLTIRSTWGEGFLEPSLFQLYYGAAFTLASTSLPGGQPQPETTEEIDSNPNLQPEDSRTWSAGVVYTPSWMPNLVANSTLTVSIDLWDIERTGVVIVPSAQDVIHRFLTNTLNPGEEVDIDVPSQTVTFLRTNYSNAGKENARGADFGILFSIQTGFGTFTSTTQATYLDSFIFQSSNLARAREVSGRTNSDPFEGAFFGQVTGGDGWVKWKGNTRLDWDWNNWNFGWTLHYFDGYHEKFEPQALVDAFGVRQEHWVHSTWFNDAQLSYELIFTPPVEQQPVAGYSKGKDVVESKEGKGKETAAVYSMPCWQTILNNSKFTVGVNNVFGQDPPKQFGFQNGNSTGYPGFQYDNLGRFVYVELKKKF